MYNVKKQSKCFSYFKGIHISVKMLVYFLFIITIMRKIIGMFILLTDKGLKLRLRQNINILNYI